MANGRSEPPRVLCLVGFMGAGKTTVGRALAERLGWEFVDLDARIEAEAGRTIPEIFAQDGEEAFRLIEGRLGAELLSGEGLVLATGGGWGAAPGRISEVPSGVCVIWLDVAAEVAVARVLRQAPGRPLLDGVVDPVRTASELLERRVVHYADAELHIDTTEREVDEIVARILEHTFPDAVSGPSDSHGPNV